MNLKQNDICLVTFLLQVKSKYVVKFSTNFLTRMQKHDSITYTQMGVERISFGFEQPYIRIFYKIPFELGGCGFKGFERKSKHAAS